MTLTRAYFTCRRCGAHAHALDERLGADGFVSPQAQRLLCLVGAEWSFDRAARYLREVAGLVVCDNTVRKVCDRHGGAMRAWQREDPQAGRAFAEARGDVEFQTDGTAVNTTGGWREMRLSVFAKRPRGGPVAPDAWDRQRLPAPAARVAAAGIRTAEALGPQWRRAAARLGVRDAAAITVIADGAKWIWSQVDRNLPGAAGVLDIFHAGEHLHAAAVARHGEGTAAARDEAARWRRTLLESGAATLLERLRADPGDVGGLIAYLGPHVGHTAYRRRLAEGRSIGSGLVEGACKTVVGRRLKQTGARWRVRRVERMAALCCVLYGDQWDTYWSKAAG